MWGLDTDRMLMERIHLFAIKRFLNGSIRPLVLVLMFYSETGRHPLFTNMHAKSVAFWLHILKMSPHRLPHHIKHVRCCCIYMNKTRGHRHPSFNPRMTKSYLVFKKNYHKIVRFFIDSTWFLDTEFKSIVRQAPGTREKLSCVTYFMNYSMCSP